MRAAPENRRLFDRGFLAQRSKAAMATRPSGGGDAADHSGDATVRRPSPGGKGSGVRFGRTAVGQGGRWTLVGRGRAALISRLRQKEVAPRDDGSAGNVPVHA